MKTIFVDSNRIGDIKSGRLKYLNDIATVITSITVMEERKYKPLKQIKVLKRPFITNDHRCLTNNSDSVTSEQGVHYNWTEFRNELFRLLPAQSSSQTQKDAEIGASSLAFSADYFLTNEKRLIKGYNELAKKYNVLSKAVSIEELIKLIPPNKK
jgi:hypothetical protein